MNRRIPLPAQFLNRELGFLAFNRRVLAQAADDTVPLLEALAEGVRERRLVHAKEE